MFAVPEVRGWKWTDFRESFAPKISGVPRMVPTSVFELLTATLMDEAGVTLAYPRTAPLPSTIAGAMVMGLSGERVVVEKLPGL